MKSKKNNRLITVFLVLIMLTGVGLMLYPTISDYWNSIHQSKAIASYVKSVESTEPEDTEYLWTSAQEYNRKLAETGIAYELPAEKKSDYQDQLRIPDSEVMVVVEIPSIKCRLPVYHGTDEAVLQVAAGHLEWSSLPVGGESTHCVISGHRGLPSAKLFTDLDKIVEGELFMVHVLGRTLTYQVDQIRTVLPEEMDDLEIEAGQDHCTLVTCTPYGVNSHRLLVRGSRVENIEEASLLVSDASRIDPMLVSFVLIMALLFVILIWLVWKLIKEKRQRR